MNINVGTLRVKIIEAKKDAELKKDIWFDVKLNAEEAEYLVDAIEHKNYRFMGNPEAKSLTAEKQGETFIGYKSAYKDTVGGMLSANYKERFKAEYQQTKIRYEKLNTFCNRIEAAMRTGPEDAKRVQMPEHDCPLGLLRDQQRAMGEYLHCLEIRAVIEDVDLN